jgi:hypothetical protein
MHGYRAGQGSGRARVLYLFRSPPNVQIGRKSLDAEVREALEHTHPDISFDWVGLLREPMPPARPDPRDRGPRQRSQGRRDRPAGREREGAAPAAPPPIELVDESLLGQTLGAAAAAVLRARFADLNHRIARRSRTPEERDRLLEAAQRLNPDQWADEAAIRANTADIDARWEAVAAELPRRRRGRRGGKPREDDIPGSGEDQTDAADVIIGQRDDSHEPETQDPQGLADAAGPSDRSDAQRPTAPASDGATAGDAPEADIR